MRLPEMYRPLIVALLCSRRRCDSSRAESAASADGACGRLQVIREIRPNREIPDDARVDALFRFRKRSTPSISNSSRLSTRKWFASWNRPLSRELWELQI